MPSKDSIWDHGFYLDSQGRELNGLALLSLKTALNAYFSTYKSMEYYIHAFDSSGYSDDELRYAHSTAYCEQCSEAIIHFHHFFELTFKEILRNEHPLLAEDASNKHELLHKLLKQESIADEECEKLKSIEFSVALSRLCTLIAKRCLGDGDLDFVVSSRDVLEKLNIVRNRLLHRGIYILTYTAFDELISKLILPLVNKTIELPQYRKLTRYWKYRDLFCHIDPIDEIVIQAEKGYNIGKIALLKELARASYSRPAQSFEVFERMAANKHEKMALSLSDENNVNHITECPVCGLTTLIVYEDIEFDDIDEDTLSYKKAWRYTSEVECLNCSFSINHYLKNPREYGLDISDYWESEDLSM